MSPYHYIVHVHVRAAPGLHEVYTDLIIIKADLGGIPQTATFLMTSSLENDSTVSPLPQQGFGPDIHFETLHQHNRFLYRVYTPKERSPFVDDTDPFFIAPKFDEIYARSPVEISTSSTINPIDASYADVARHMDWTTRASSAYISTSFSFTWSIWEALRRYHQGVKKDVEIAVIDAAAVADRAATTVQLLRKSSPKERKHQYWKWYRFSQESQSVLVHGFIPGTAILASIPLLSILQRMPSYFLRTKAQVITGNPLDHVAWNYMEKQPSYRQFCQDMSERFFSQSQEIRFRDATGGSIRLALTLLRPWFHRMVDQDFDLAVTSLRTLAIIIAQWPGQWWAKDHSELNKIIESMALAVGEELRQKHSNNDQEELTRLHSVVETLEAIISSYELERDRIRAQGAAILAEISKETPPPSALVTPEHSPRLRPRKPVSMSVSVPPRGIVSFQTPITPPESPRNSWSLSSSAQYQYVPPVTYFQPLSSPELYFDRPRSRVNSAPSSPLARNSAPTTPSSLQFSSPLPRPESSRPTTPSSFHSAPPSPIIQHPRPATPTSHHSSSPVASQLDDITSEISDNEEMSSEAPDYPRFVLPIIPSIPAYTSHATLPEVPGFISDLYPGLRINIPNFQSPSLLPPSPTDSIGSRHIELQSPFSSPRTLAPSSPQFVSKCDDSASIRLRSPSSMSSIADSSWDELPPLPISPAVSWGSISSTLPSRAPSPQPMNENDLSFTTVSSSSQLRKTFLSASSLSSVQLSSSRSSNSSLSLENVDSTGSARVSPIQGPMSTPHLSPIRSRTSFSSFEELQLTPHSIHDSPQSVIKSPLLSRSVEDSPQLEVSLYLPPRPAISLLVSSISRNSDEDENAIESDEESSQRRHPPALVETASFIVTGFLVGAFITLFLISTQRRTLLYVT